MSAFLPGDDRQKLAWREKALQLHEDVSRLDPDNDFSHSLDLAQCHHDLATLLQLAKRWPEAEKHFDRAIALMTAVGGKQPQNLGIKLGVADSYCNLGQLYHFTGRRELAESAFERADALYDQLMHEEIALTPPTISRSVLAINWGNLYLQMGKIDKALASYDRGIVWSEGTLTKEPNNPQGRDTAFKLHGSRANVYDAQQRFAEAATEWKRVVELAEGPARKQYRMRWCVSLACAGDSVHAAAEVEALVAEPGCTPDLLYNLACVFALSGRAEKAVALLNQLRSKGFFDKADNLKTLRRTPISIRCGNARISPSSRRDCSISNSIGHSCSRNSLRRASSSVWPPAPLWVSSVSAVMGPCSRRLSSRRNAPSMCRRSSSREPAVELAQQFAHDLAALRLEILRQPRDHRAIAPTRPVLEERLRFLIDDRLGRLDVLETIARRRLADAFQIVDVEQAGAVAVVDARIEVARHGDVENDQRAARSPGVDALVALRASRSARERRWCSGRCRPSQQVVEFLPRHRLAAAAARHGRGLFRTAIRRPRSAAAVNWRRCRSVSSPILPAPMTRMVLSPK